MDDLTDGDGVLLSEMEKCSSCGHDHLSHVETGCDTCVREGIPPEEVCMSCQCSNCA